MPRLDKTGPQGVGPNTGRGMGPCNDANATVEGFPQGGRGFRRFSGRQGCFGRNRFNNQNVGNFATKEQEKEFLENQIKFLETQIAQLKDRSTKLDV
ncbi:MAG TPA: DUF5320 domain-containing protein [Bacilli bacterium]|nr:DUF5320 domain-containing protein [Bacilli bacterium]